MSFNIGSQKAKKIVNSFDSNSWVKTQHHLPGIGVKVIVTRFVNGNFDWLSTGMVSTESGLWSVRIAQGLTLDNSIPTHWMPLNNPKP